MKHDKTLIARIDDTTVKNLADVKKALSLHSGAEAVRRSVSIARTLLSALKKGDKIVLVGRNGSQRELMID